MTLSTDNMTAYARSAANTSRNMRLDVSGIDWGRRAPAQSDLLEFISTYMVRGGPGAEARAVLPFDGPLFGDQIRQVRRMQDAVLAGERYAVAAFRGGGKTSAARCAILWAALSGHSDFSVLVGAIADDAANNLEAIKLLLTEHDILAADFAEACQPLRALDGSTRRAALQTIDGVLAHTQCSADTIILPEFGVEPYLPDIPAEYREFFGACRGTIIATRPISGATRGLNIRGRRPSLVLLDDVENERSVRSAAATTDIRRRISTAIRGLSRRTEALGMILIGTIQDDDSVTAEYTASHLWNGERYSYLRSLPTDSDAWNRYMEIRADASAEGGPERAREFYRTNRETMDAGAEATWPEGYDASKYESPVEYYYAEMTDNGEEGPRFCACELQNDPSLMRSDDGPRVLSPGEVSARLSRLDRGRIPSEAHAVTCHVDVHGVNSCLYYSVVAWREYLGGWIIDHGTFPTSKTIGEAYPGLSQDAAIGRALRDLDDLVRAKHLVRDDGMDVRPVFGADAGSSWADCVYAFCRERSWIPTKGQAVRFRDFNTTGPKDCRRGDAWREMPAVVGRWKIAGRLFESNVWKSRVLDLLSSDPAEPASLVLFGSSTAAHAEYARHLTSEVPRIVVEKSTGNEYTEFGPRPGRENHWFDTLVGCAVLASASGIRTSPDRPGRRSKPKRGRVQIIPI